LESIDGASSTLFSRVATPVHHPPRRRGGGARGASSAQQDGRVRRIGWLLDKDESDSVVTTYKAALREPLA